MFTQSSRDGAGVTGAFADGVFAFPLFDDGEDGVGKGNSGERGDGEKEGNRQNKEDRVHYRVEDEGKMMSLHGIAEEEKADGGLTEEQKLRRRELRRQVS